METRDYRATEIPLSDADRKKLLDKLKKYKTITTDKLGDLVENAREASSFMLGNHFESQRTSGDEKSTPEELGGRDRVYPNVPYLVHRIDKIVQYLMHDNASPFVEAEDCADFDVPPDHPMAQMLAQSEVQQAFSAGSHNEMAAKIMSAYLDWFRDKSDDDENMATVAENACAETIAAVVVGFDPSAASPKVFIDRVRIGDFGFDPDAMGQDVTKGRWVYYIERGRRRHDVLAEYGVAEAEGNNVLYDVDQTNADHAQGPQRSFSDSGHGEQSSSDTAPSPNKIIDVWHWWIRDTSSVEVTDPETGETTTAQKYNGGWQYAVVAGERVIFNGDSRNPQGCPPLFTFTYRPVGDRITGLSAYQQVKDINKAMDRLQQYSLEAAYKMQPKTLIDRNKVKNFDKLAENTVAGFVDIDVKAGDISGAYAYLPGGSGGSGLVEQMAALRNLGDEILGTAQLSMDDASRTQLSGDALDGLMADRDGVLARLRDRFYKFQRKVYRCLLAHAIAYDDNVVTLKVNGPDGAPVYVPVAMADMNLAGTDFELAFDVKIDAVRNAPKNPVKRSAYTLQTVQAMLGLAQTAPAVALGVLEIMDVPDKAKLREIIAAVPQAQKGGGPDPVATEQAKNDMAVKRRIAESQSDAYESVIKDIARIDPQKAVDLIQQFPAMVWNQYQAVPGAQQGAPQGMPQGMPMPDGVMPQDAPMVPPAIEGVPSV